MTNVEHLTTRYDNAAGRWGDKMRTLGYADAYLGFLAAGPRAGPRDRVCDVGCGSGAFAEAWMGIHGPASRITLLDPSRSMLTRAEAALARRGGRAQVVQDGLEGFQPKACFDYLLAAHVLEHVPEPAAALRRMRAWVQPGGRLWLVVSKPHWCNALIWLQWRHRAFRQAEVSDCLAVAGWRLDDTYAFPSGPPSRNSRGYRATAV